MRLKSGLKGKGDRLVQALLARKMQGKADGCKADGCKADGCKADGCKADGCMAYGCKADGCKADGCKASGEEARRDQPMNRLEGMMQVKQRETEEIPRRCL